VFRVIWGREILDSISAAYDAATPADRERILESAARIDEALAQSPMSSGESREHSHIRVLVEGPLAATYRVDVSKQLVFISRVKFHKRRDPS
jgi:hypothetical protein